MLEAGKFCTGLFNSIILLFGLCFELPMLLWLLSIFGIINREFLKKFRRHAIVVILVLAALITPTGDPVTLAIVFAPSIYDTNSPSCSSNPRRGSQG